LEEGSLNREEGSWTVQGVIAMLALFLIIDLLWWLR
jgi:hypothetical protein